MSTVRRYTAEELLRMSDNMQSFTSKPLDGDVKVALRQASETEAKAMGLVAQLEIIASDWENTANAKDKDDYTFGRAQVATVVIEEIRDALSKFRGEDNA